MDVGSHTVDIALVRGVPQTLVVAHVALRTHQQLEGHVLGPRRVAQQRRGVETLDDDTAELVGGFGELNFDAVVVGGFLVDLDLALAVPEGEGRGTRRDLPEGLFRLWGGEGGRRCGGAVEGVDGDVEGLAWLGDGGGEGERLAVICGKAAARCG